MFRSKAANGCLLILFLVLMVRWRASNGANVQDDALDIYPSDQDAVSIKNTHEWEDDITSEFLHHLDKSTHKCTNYLDYSTKRHPPLSKGKHRFPYMRPAPKCRTFTSQALEKLIVDLKAKMKSPDLARLMENALPNTLDTTILWHNAPKNREDSQTFVVTGDIHAEWLRDSARQLSVFQPLIKYDPALKTLIEGAIHTQERYILEAPYCNAFHPPAESKVKKADSAKDNVFPSPNWDHVFECKYEIDSLASFLTLTNEYLENSDHDLSIINEKWISAYEKVLVVLQRESKPSFDPKTGYTMPFFYSFQRDTNIGSETLPLGGVGNPVNYNTGLIRSAFRPSDDATVLQFFVPGNAHMLAELKKIKTNVFDKINPDEKKARVHFELTKGFIETMEKGLQTHAIINHPKWGRVYAYEVDGYGGSVMMDDANIPSLLSLPELGYVEVDDPVYQNTRKMILSKDGNPYFIKGPHFEGIGGPHIGIRNAWPMSLLMRIRTTKDDKEIQAALEFIMSSTAGLGLMHESVNVFSPRGTDYTRPWFAWCNSELGKTILYLAKHKPHLIFKKEYASAPYDIDALFTGKQ